MPTQLQPDRFCAYRPAPPLDQFVEQLWYWEGIPPAHAKDRLMPSGSASLVINLAEDEIRDYTGANGEFVHRYPGAVLVGAYSKYSVIDASEQRAVLGVTFKPGGMWPFFDPAADELHNAHAALQDLWGSVGASLRERILALPAPYERLRLVETQLLAQAIRPMRQRAEVNFALAQLTRQQNHSIELLSRHVGLSARRMTRLFTLQVGLTPKLYARIKRFERVMQLMQAPGIEWSDLAQTCGYFDQSHLIRDCKAISGYTPSELQARCVGSSKHVIAT